MEPYKLAVAQSASRLEGWEFAGAAPNLKETIANARATALIGLSGQAGAFDQALVQSVAANSRAPSCSRSLTPRPTGCAGDVSPGPTAPRWWPR